MATFKIEDNHIGVFDGYFSEDFCNHYIDFYNEMDRNNLTMERETDGHIKDDKAYDIFANYKYANKTTKIKEFNVNYTARDFSDIFFKDVYSLYVKKYSILNLFSKHSIQDIKLQKTEPQEGYHIWHCESGDVGNRNRIAAFILYLNSVNQGGETEFLYQSKRIKPKQGRILLFPTSYTHVHRGNPPLKGNKFILTGWVEMVPG
jgi:hypothetical protein|tara:strand:+ start:1823 stop:2434 length:612 start_codon:yes stop_codon:yes gene_type:complete